MVTKRFSRWRRRTAAYVIVGVSVAGGLGLTPTFAAQQTPVNQPQGTPNNKPQTNPQAPGTQPQTTPQTNPQTPTNQPGQPGQQPTPATPNPTTPGQTPPGQTPPGQTPPPGQTNPPAPGQQPGQNPPGQNPSTVPLPTNNTVPDHTVVFPTTTHTPQTRTQPKQLGFRLPAPDTGDITNRPNVPLPLFGWKFFESARAVIDARRSYYARFTKMNPWAAGANSPFGSPFSDSFSNTPFSGTFQNGNGPGSYLYPSSGLGLNQAQGAYPTGGLSAPAAPGLSTPMPGGDLSNGGQSPTAGQANPLGQGQYLPGQGQLGQGQLGQGGALSNSTQSSIAQALQGLTPDQISAITAQLQNGGGQQISGVGAGGGTTVLNSLPQVATPNFPGSSAAAGPVGTSPYFQNGDASGSGSSGSLPYGTRVVDPSNHIVSPDELARFPSSAPAPERYQIGPGDQLQIIVQSPTFEPHQYTVEVDNQGRILVPITGKKLVVRGMSLALLENALKTSIGPALRNASVLVTLGELRTMSVSVFGESYAPGTYMMPATVSLFNAIYTSGGPSADGSMRNITLQRSDGTTKRFDLYQEFVTGSTKGDVSLQPGDVIYIPPADNRVLVIGEVRRPATYELRTGERLKDAIHFAGGALPTGVSQKIEVESVRPGAERILTDASLDGKPNSNPELYAGDTIDVFSIRNDVMNAVSVDGAVQTPRDYGMTKGMTVADLVVSARGLRRDAYPDRADLFRQNPDKTEKLIKIDLKAAIGKDPNANIALKPFDHLVVYTFDEVHSLGNRNVTVAGAVRRPGSFYRADNMTVRDILLEAGGLELNAYMDTAYIQRTNPDGTPGELVRINLNKLLSGDLSANAPIEDLDVLTVQSVQEANFVPDEQVQVSGAVQRPGIFTRGTNMKVSDLLKLSGGLLPTAYPDRAWLQHMNLDGRVGQLEMIDLKGLSDGNPTSDVPLKTKDTLLVYTKEQAQYQAPQVVTVHGAVQNPGTYSKAPGMTLKDVLLLAGGRTPSASSKIEIAKARVQDGTAISTYDVDRVLQGDPSSNVNVEDGDMVSVPEDSTIMLSPLVVQILGDVKNPGTYLVTSRTEHLSDLVKRAGGLKPGAFPQGAQFLRDPAKLSVKAQVSLTPHIVSLLQLVQTDEYNRALARGDVDKIRAVVAAQQAAQGTPISLSSNGAASTTPPLSGGYAAQAEKTRDPVTPARVLAPSDLTVDGNLNVNVKDALSRPHGDSDLFLIDGDTITIPEKPVNIEITGAVIVPKALIFQSGKTLGYYLQNVGGFTADAAKDDVLIIRSTGNVQHANSGTKLMLGDVVFVPTKVMADRLHDRQADFTSAVNTITSAGLLLAVVRALTK